MVYIFLADGFEEVEALTPLDLLRRANVDVCTVGIGGNLITGSHQITVKADLLEDNFSLANAEMLILPGGAGHTILENSSFVKSSVLAAYEKGVPLAAICAAPSLLGKWDLLQGKNAVCFPGFEQFLKGATVLYNPVITDGQITTSRGAGCAIPFSLELVRILCGEETSQKIGESIQYDVF